jgi:hypothetical protein
MSMFQISIEVAFRVKDSVAVGSTLTLTIDIYAGDTTGSAGFTQDIVFTVSILFVTDTLNKRKMKATGIDEIIS